MSKRHKLGCGRKINRCQHAALFNIDVDWGALAGGVIKTVTQPGGFNNPSVVATLGTIIGNSLYSPRRVIVDNPGYAYPTYNPVANAGYYDPNLYNNSLYNDSQQFNTAYSYPYMNANLYDNGSGAYPYSTAFNSQPYVPGYSGDNSGMPGWGGCGHHRNNWGSQDNWRQTQFPAYGNNYTPYV